MNLFISSTTDAGGLRLEDAKKADVKDNLVTDRASSPLVMYFSK